MKFSGKTWYPQQESDRKNALNGILSGNGTMTKMVSPTGIGPVFAR